MEKKRIVGGRVILTTRASKYVGFFGGEYLILIIARGKSAHICEEHRKCQMAKRG